MDNLYNLLTLKPCFYLYEKKMVLLQESQTSYINWLFTATLWPVGETLIRFPPQEQLYHSKWRTEPEPEPSIWNQKRKDSNSQGTFWLWWCWLLLLYRHFNFRLSQPGLPQTLSQSCFKEHCSFKSYSKSIDCSWFRMSGGTLLQKDSPVTAKTPWTMSSSSHCWNVEVALSCQMQMTPVVEWRNRHAQSDEVVWSQLQTVVVDQ